MIYFEGKVSHLVEAVYLGESISDRAGDNCSVFVNPDHIKYIVGKTVIINCQGYPKEKIDELLGNKCQVIERCINSGVPVTRYILRICPELHWNGVELDGSSCQSEADLEKLISEYHWAEVKGKLNLYFPKITGLPENLIMDSGRNLTWAGWALYQVGLNVLPEARLKDLDLLKTRKIHDIKSSE